MLRVYVCVHSELHSLSDIDLLVKNFVELAHEFVIFWLFASADVAALQWLHYGFRKVGAVWTRNERRKVKRECECECEWWVWGEWWVWVDRWLGAVQFETGHVKLSVRVRAELCVHLRALVWAVLAVGHCLCLFQADQWACTVSQHLQQKLFQDAPQANLPLLNWVTCARATSYGSWIGCLCKEEVKTSLTRVFYFSSYRAFRSSGDCSFIWSMQLEERSDFNNDEHHPQQKQKRIFRAKTHAMLLCTQNNAKAPKNVFLASCEQIQICEVSRA